MANQLYVDLDSLAFPPNCVVWTLGALALTSHLISRCDLLNLKALPVATAPAELMVVRLDPKSSQFFRGDGLLTWHPAPSRRSSSAADLEPRTVPELEGAWPHRNEVGKRPVT